jgi:hypothetical protein
MRKAVKFDAVTPSLSMARKEVWYGVVWCIYKSRCEV